MKKFLLFFALCFVLPVNALCPIEAGENVCSISDVNTSLPAFQNPNSSSNINNTQKQLQPFKTEGSINGINQPDMNNMNYNTGCQFGSCVQDLTNTNNKNQ